jgi:D-cysteine desulfhydrase
VVRRGRPLIEAGRVELARTPTPLVRLDRLSAHLGADVWCKRDDLTGRVLSGNKVRKLEWLLAEALRVGADTVLTTGGIQSNHARATAAAARQLGMRPVLLLRGRDPGVPEANLLLDRLLGAEVHWCTPQQYRDERDVLLATLAEDVARAGGRPYVVPEGGSNGLGALGYVRAAEELAAQTAEPFDVTVCAVGSGGTVAGLALGPDRGPVLGVAVCDDRATFAPRVRAIAAAARTHGAGPLGPEGERWSIVEGYQGPAYAVATPEVWDTIALEARLEGLILDPVYTGKAFHALRSEVEAGRWGGRLLFWHTGGVYGLFGRGAEIPRGRRRSASSRTRGRAATTPRAAQGRSRTCSANGASSWRRPTSRR